MNKEELKELAATLNGIADGKAWEYCCFTGPKEEWFESMIGTDPVSLLARGQGIRLKPQPDPYAELKAAHAAGKVIQQNSMLNGAWVDDNNPIWNLCVVQYRIKPEQQKVPLGPRDVPPGTVFRFHGHNDNHHYLPTLVAGPKDGVYFTDTTHFRRDWIYLMENATINRSIPITGKWNPEAWEPCCKLIDKP